MAAAKHEIAYRPDIDGLRAVAVLFVVIFHAFPAALPGGFTGVDIFFVISGYLISSILIKDLNRGTFSYAGFYARRFRRILPALLFMLLAVWGMGRAYLSGDQFSQLGKHSLGGLGFCANIMFWSEAGYFDIGSIYKPLLHLWSLGIEEQFYLFWPFILAFLFRHNRRLAFAIGILIALSFGVSIVETYTEALRAQAFYLLPARFWELLAGGLLGLWEFRRGRAGVAVKWSGGLSAAALALLIVSGALVRDSVGFPGFVALVPVLAAVAVIAAGSAGWLNRLLSWRPIVAVGLISYPLYLWHWPLLSFATILNDGKPSVQQRLMAVGLALLMSVVTYWLIEKPVKRMFPGSLSEPAPIWRVLRVSFVGLLVAGVLSAFTYEGYFQNKVFEVMRGYGWHKGQSEAAFWEKGCFTLGDETFAKFERNGCLVQPLAGRPTVVLLGDSHAAYLSKALRPYLEKKKLNFVQMTVGWCAPLAVDDANSRCAEINRRSLEAVRAMNPQTVIIFANYLLYKDPKQLGAATIDDLLSRESAQLVAAGVRHVVILGQFFTWRINLPQFLSWNYLAHGKAIPERTYDGLTETSAATDSSLRARTWPANVEYVSLRERLCTAAGCPVLVGPNPATDLIVWDYGHLTLPGANYVIEKVLDPALTP